MNENKKFWIMVIMLGLLIIVSGVQTFELVIMNDRISDDTFQPQIAGQQDKKGLSIADLPPMRGSC